MAAGELPSVVIHRCRRIAVDELRGYVERLVPTVDLGVCALACERPCQ